MELWTQPSLKNSAHLYLWCTSEKNHNVWEHIIPLPHTHIHHMQCSQLYSLNLAHYWKIPLFSASRMKLHEVLISLSLHNKALWKAPLLLRGSQNMYFPGSVGLILGWTHHGGLIIETIVHRSWLTFMLWKQRENVKSVYNGAVVSGHSLNI